MRTNIKATNIALTDAIRQYLEKRMAAFDRFVDTESDSFLLEAELGRTTKHHQGGDIFRAEVNVNIEGKRYRAVSEKSDLYTAIDDVKEEIFAEIKKSKGRTRSLLKRGGQTIKNIIRGFKKK